MNWFYAKDGHPAGPVDDEEFERLRANGAVAETTLVWHSGMAEWKPYNEMPPALKPPALVEIEEVSEDETGPLAPVEAAALPYAGFWIRVAAVLFDLLILLPVLTLLYIGFIMAFPDFLAAYPIGASSKDIFDVVWLAIFTVYQGWFVGRFGATPGKMICHLRVINSGGGPISYGRAAGRSFCYVLSCLFFGAGFIMAGMNREKCALHDFFCDTRVIHADGAN